MIAPGIFVTVYNDLRGAKALPALDALAPHAAPKDFGVCIHDPPSGDDAGLAQAITSRGWRLMYGWGVDPDARRSVDEAAAVTLRRARLAADRGAEAIELNGEKAWKAEGLDAHARAMIAACRAGAPGLPVGWSFFDGPRTHRMPASVAVFGACGVDYSAPQVYAATGTGEPASHRAALARFLRAEEQHRWAVDRGLMRAELIPGREACAVYAQLHSVSAAGTAWLLDRGPVGRAWAIPTRCDAEGLRGLSAVLLARRETGCSAGAIARWQAAHGLTADGIAGPVTLGAMGL